MNSEQASALFHQALDIADPAERLGYLKGACGDDAELLAHVQKLLAAHAAAEGVFPTDPGESPTLEATADLSRRSFAEAKAEGPGTVIGKYKLLEQIGEGGMGVVYLAEQREPFVKRVALKVIKLGMDTKAVVARFNAEYQALALMNHPSIAKVLDAGATDSGRPFFVMEYIRGVPITEYCDDKKLSTRQRLELFIPVCQAVQHAHQKGIIHRDLKPSNVLVANFDGRPVPMIIDFGIAKAVNQRLGPDSFFTRHGQFIGTLEYIAPEQAEGSQLDIDTRADIYSLGVLLYQLLTGTTPFPGKRLRESAWRETMRIIQEEEPPLPSHRMSTLTAEQGTTIEQTHGGEAARKISLVLRRELDLVVMGCLEKDRNRRYETANALAKDLERYLQGEAVSRVPPKPGYLLTKFARKHKKTVAMAAAIAVILAGATAFSTWQMVRARTAEGVATQQVEKLGAINGWMNRDLLPQVNPWTAGDAGQQRSSDIRLKDAILQSALRLTEDFKDHPEIEGEIRLTIGKALQALGLGKEAEENLRRAIELLEQTAGPDHTNTLGAKLSLGAMISWQVFGIQTGRHAERGAEAGRLLSEACERAKRQFGQGNLFTVVCTFELARHFVNFWQLDEADVLFQELQVVLKDYEGGNQPLSHHFRSRYTSTLAELRIRQVRMAEARREARRSHELVSNEAILKNTNSSAAVHALTVNLETARWLYEWDRDFAKAERILQTGLEQSKRLVNDGHPTEVYLGLLAILHHQAGNPDKWVHYWRQGADLLVRDAGPSGGHSTLQELRAVGGYFLDRLDWEGAANEFRRQRTELLVTDGILLSMEALASRLAGRHQDAEARRQDYFRVLTRQLSNGMSADDYAAAADRSALLAILSLPCSGEELRLLEAGFEEASRIQSDQPWWRNGRAGDILLGFLAIRQGHPVEAIQHLEPALDAAGNHRANVSAHYALALAYHGAGRVGDAIKRFQHAEALIASTAARGTLVGGESAAMAMALRQEAAALIQPPEPLTPITLECLAPKRQAWSEVRQLVETGNLQARRREYRAAADSYAAAIAHRAFNWTAAHEDWVFFFRAFTVAWALGDADLHIEILRKMHEGLGENETTHLYQLAEAPWPLPDDLEVRRKQSASRRKLEERGADPSQKFEGRPGGEEALILGMLAYREGQPDKALTFLAIPSGSTVLHHRVAGPAFAAMAHEQLGNREKALRLLKLADQRFHDMVIVPGDGMYQPDFPPVIMMEMVIKEADQLIDPDVVNAPHVAALPDNGWPQ
jgi:serine/threonine protein kinase/tetratricopeptide (TPR) repeat protein